MTPVRRLATTIVAIAVGTLLGVALLFAQIHRAPETYPWGDAATTSIYVLRAVHGDLSVGAYSRYHWNHPGPLLYELLAPLYAISGYREVSIKWAMLMLNVSALAYLLIAVRRKAPTLALTLALALAPLLYREQRLLFWAWNPMAPLLPLALMMALAADIATSGGLGYLPLLCGVVSFMVQAHIGFVPPVCAVLAAAALLLVWQRRHERALELRDSVRSIAIALATLAVLWALPLAHEWTTRPGNLVAIAQFFDTAPREPRSWWTIFVIFANQFVGPLAPGWALTTNEASTAVSWPVLAFAAIQFPLLAVIGIRAFHRAAAYQESFAVVCLAASLAGVLAVHSIVGPVSDYLVTWIVVVGALSLAVIAAEAIRVTRPSARAQISAVRWILATYVVAVTILGGNRLIAKQTADSRSIVMRTLASDLAQYCRTEAIDRPLLGFSDDAWDGATGMILQYYKQGRPIAVPDDSLFLVGSPFKATGREAAEFYLMKTEETIIPPGVMRYHWLATFGSYRLIRVFRDS
jgi:hypothetical protein